MRKGIRRFIKPGGIALVLTLLSLSLLAVIGFGLVSITTVQSRIAINQQDSSKAYYLARMGIAKAIDELESNYYWGTSGTYTQTLDLGNYSVSVWASPNNDGNENKVWKIVSRGESGEAERTLTSWVRVEPLCAFAYCSNSEISAVTGTVIWFTNKDKLLGPVHTNGYFSIYSNPVFDNKVTSNNTGDPFWLAAQRRYYQGGLYYTDPKKFYHYYNGYSSDYPTGTGNFSFAGGQTGINIPPSPQNIAEKADKTYTSEITITFKETGFADVSYKTPEGTRLTEEVSTNNVTIYSNDKITLNAGTIKGKVTVSSPNNIIIKGNLVYKDKNVDNLGIIAGQDIVVNTPIDSASDLTINGTLISLNGSFYVHKYNEGIPRGTLKLFGSLIQHERGPVGTFYASTGAPATGYCKSYTYDYKLLTQPPPHCPPTGRIRLVSLQDSAAISN